MTFKTELPVRIEVNQNCIDCIQSAPTLYHTFWLRKLKLKKKLFITFAFNFLTCSSTSSSSFQFITFNFVVEHAQNVHLLCHDLFIFYAFSWLRCVRFVVLCVYVQFGMDTGWDTHTTFMHSTPHVNEMQAIGYYAFFLLFQIER